MGKNRLRPSKVTVSLHSTAWIGTAMAAQSVWVTKRDKLVCIQWMLILTRKCRNEQDNSRRLKRMIQIRIMMIINDSYTHIILMLCLDHDLKHECHDLMLVLLYNTLSIK